MANYTGETRLRVYNRCRHMIGVTLLNGQQLAINPKSFQLLTVNDIFYIDSMCNTTKFFSQRMLVPVDDNNKDLSLDDLGFHVDESLPVHLNDDETKAMLKQTNKKVEAWINSIEDKAELFGIYEIAKELDLPGSKMAMIEKKLNPPEE